MQWSQIKTLLILSFLVLNIYLLIQFLEKREQADIGILEYQQSSIEEQLKSESIELGELPKEQYEESYISVKPKLFTESDLHSLNKFKKQDAIVLNKSLIVSHLEKPIAVSKKSNRKELEKLLENTILFAEDYSFWSWNEQLNVIMYIQKDGDRPIYYNQNGLVLFFLNDNDEAVLYTQTYLGESERRAEKRDLITPLKAIEILYNQNELHYGDEITSVNIGFHTRVPLESGVQVFAPSWKVNINNNKDYFVNAIEGVVFSNDENEFLNEAIQSNLDRVEHIRDNGTLKATFLKILSDRLQ